MALRELLIKHKKPKTDTSVYYTHVSLIKPRGRFQLELDDLELFWQHYSVALKNNEAVGIAEISQNYIAAIFDVDLAVEIAQDQSDPQSPLYMPEDIEYSIKVLVNVFYDELEISNEKMLTCAVLEKTGYRRGTHYKNGYHLHFPFLFVEKKWYNEFLIPKISDLIAGLDVQSGKVPWLLYGSVKDDTKKSYSITSVYDCRLARVPISALASMPLFNSFGHKISIPPEDIYPYIPRILSIIPMHREITKQKAPPLQTFRIQDRSFSALPDASQESLDVAAKLVEMLAPHRAEDRSTWLRVGWILHHQSNGSEPGFNIWLDFSRKCPDKFSETTCHLEWSRMGTRFGLALGTLFFWAAQDSPTRCEQLKQDRRESILNNFVVSSHYGIAKYLKQMYGHEFVCADIKLNLWYQCVRGLWIRLAEPYTLRGRLSEEVARDFNTLNITIINKMNRNIGAPDVNLEAKAKQITKLVQNLRNHQFKLSVISEAVDKFFEPDFLKKLDCDPYLIAFQNGVYDLKQNLFRPFLPEDHVSKRLPIDYIVFNPTDVAFTKMLDFISKIFPDEGIRRYFLDVYSEIFVGGNHSKHIYFWTGFGDNGKSVTQSLFEKMLGSHAIKISTTVFSGKKGNLGNASPELARAAPPVRLLVMEEPDTSEQLNVGVMKNFSGNDTFWARDLYQAGRDTTEITPFFKITFICNRLPKIKNADEATFNRIRVIPFESTFKARDQCPASLTDQLEKKIFPRNTNIMEDMESIAVAFAFYLLEYRKNKRSSTLVEPMKVAAATINYRERNDIYYQFITEMLVINDPTQTPLDLAAIFDLFKLWYRQRKAGDFAPEFLELERYFQQKWGDQLPPISQADLNEQIKNGKVYVHKG